VSVEGDDDAPPSTEPEPCPATQQGHRLGFVAVLLGLVGMTAPAEAYLQLVDPAGPAAERRAVADESDCILVALGAEELFFDCDRTTAYVNGSAPRLLEARAGGSPMAPGGALRLATKTHPPALADALWWGGVPGFPEHVEHVVAVRYPAPLADPDLLEVDVVAGGERKGGKETVEKLTRTLRWDGKRYVDPATRRPVIGVVDCELLAARLGVRSEAA
jgi:hypothetical protein